MGKYIITTLGCKVNQSESDAIARVLERTGWVPASRNEHADLCIINTCAVTGKASMQSRQAARKMIRSHPGARVVVTGCDVRIDSSIFEHMTGVSDVVTNDEKPLIPKILNQGIESTLSPPSLMNPEQGPPPYPLHDRENIDSGRSRPFLKIQDGCNTFCTYCIVPYTRGRSRSLSPDMVLDHIRQFSSEGYQEVVLTGIHLGHYGMDLSPKTDLGSLLVRICTEKPIHRVRLSSIEPAELTCDIIHLVAESDYFCHHFHIPLQSGDDHILNRMHRPYDRAIFKETVLNIHAAVPDAAIGTDVLVGFPGETDAAFENTMTLIEELPITYLHVFPFSPRQGTPASSYADQIPVDVIKKRSSALREHGQKKRKAFYERFLGKTVEIVVEAASPVNEEIVKGTSSNYIPVFVASSLLKKRSVAVVRIDKIDGLNGVWGTMG